MTIQQLQQLTATPFSATSLASMIEQVCSRFADNIALSCRGVNISFSRLESESRAFAAWLQHHSTLVPGDRIALQMPNCVQYLICAFGALRAGLVLVNTSPQYTEPELIYQFNDARPKALVVLSDLLPGLAKVIKNTPVELVISTHIKDLLSLQPQPRTALQNQEYNHILDVGRRLEFSPVNISPTQLALLQYTGGTSGVIKAAMLSHGNILANLQQCSSQLTSYINDGEEVLVSPLPLYHIYSFIMHLLYFSHGARSLLIPSTRDVGDMLKGITAAPMTVFAGLNTLFNALSHNAQFQELTFSSLKLTISGGTALSSNTAQAWQSVTGCVVSQGYGLTECSPVVSINLQGNQLPESIGKPLPGTEIQIVDDHYQQVAQGVAGELWVKGPQLMQGYWRQPAETQLVMTEDGFFKTGDIAKQDEQGNLFIVDRIKDIIIVSGFNVYPTEVEKVLDSHPSVIESAVFAVENERTGEQVQARIVLKKGEHIHAVETALQQLCEDNLAPYKIPKAMEFVSELPLTNIGKILRR